MKTNEIVVNKLIDNSLTISTAESMTGGMLASSIIDVPNASFVIEKSFITYSDFAKKEILDVSDKTLSKEGAVSYECAMEMVDGLSNISDADINVAVTGYAGPDDKKAGLVFIGIGYGDKIQVSKFKLSGTRNEVRRKAVNCALGMISRLVDDIIADDYVEEIHTCNCCK